jgi:hypothetical protein
VYFNVDGEVSVDGSVTLIGAVHIEGDGEVTVTGSGMLLVTTVPPSAVEGYSGGEIDYQKAGSVTQRSWAWKHARPEWYDTRANRAFGAKLGGVKTRTQPAYDRYSDPQNKLEQYVRFWSWMTQSPNDVDALANAADSTYPGAVMYQPGMNVVTVSDAQSSPVDFNGDYTETGRMCGHYQNANGCFLVRDYQLGKWVLTENLFPGEVDHSGALADFGFPDEATWTSPHIVQSTGVLYYTMKLISWPYYISGTWCPGSVGGLPLTVEESGMPSRYLRINDTDAYLGGSYELVWDPYRLVWVVRDVNAAYPTVAVGGDKDMFPWSGTWTGATVALKSTKWGPTGLTMTGEPTAPTDYDLARWLKAPKNVSFLGDFTILLDFTVDATSYQVGDLVELNFPYPGPGYLRLSYGLSGWEAHWYDSHWGYSLLAGGGFENFHTGTRNRIVMSCDRDGDLSLYLNGVQKSAVDNSDWQCNPDDDKDAIELSLFREIWRGIPQYWLSFGGIVHEVGILEGYAATATDVACNPMFAKPWGLAAPAQYA